MTTNELSGEEKAQWNLCVDVFSAHFRETHAHGPNSDAHQTMESLSFYVHMLYRVLPLKKHGTSPWSKFALTTQSDLLGDAATLGKDEFYSSEKAHERRNWADRYLNTLLRALDNENLPDWKQFVGETRRKRRQLNQSFANSTGNRADEFEKLKDELWSNETRVRALFFLPGPKANPESESEAQPQVKRSASVWAEMDDEKRNTLRDKGPGVPVDHWIAAIAAALDKIKVTFGLKWNELCNGTIDWPLLGLPARTTEEEWLDQFDETVRVFTEQFIRARENEAESEDQQQRTLDALSLYLFVLNRSVRDPAEWNKINPETRLLLKRKLIALSLDRAYLPSRETELRHTVDGLGTLILEAVGGDEGLVGQWTTFVAESRTLEWQVQRHLRYAGPSPDPLKLSYAHLKEDEAWVRALVFLRRPQGGALLTLLSEEDQRKLLVKPTDDSIEHKIDRVTETLDKIFKREDLIPLKKAAKEAVEWPLLRSGLHSLARLSPARRTTNLRVSVLRSLN